MLLFLDNDMKRKRQGRVLGMVPMKEILRLRELGFSQVAIARSLQVARSTVQDYVCRADTAGLTYEEALKLCDTEILARLGKGQRRDADKAPEIDYAWVTRELQRKGVTLELLWLEKRAELKCGYSTFCRCYRRWEVRQNLSMRQIYKAGEKVFVDYCGVKVPLVDLAGAVVTEAQIFVACLGASSYTFAEATPSQGLAYWLGSHERAFQFFQGVPAVAVPDNLKSGVNQSCRYEPEINRSYQDFAEHYGIAVIPARPDKPRDKAKVERAVQEVERWVLAPLRNRRFYSIAELNDAIKPLLETLNNRTMREYQASRRELFERLDKPALKPLPELSFVFATWKKAKVNLDYHIEVERHYYSLPYYFVHREVWIKVSEKVVEIMLDGKRIAFHERSRVPYGFTTLFEHMPPEHAAVKSWSADKFLLWSKRIGAETEAFVQMLLQKRAHPEQAFRSILGLQRLAQKYGSARLEAACKRANHFKLTTMRNIRFILEQNKDKQPLAVEPDPAPVSHDNVRGSSYFH
jgi:transposase